MTPRKQGISTRKDSSMRSPSPSKAFNAGQSSHGHGASAERDPCNRCIENEKKHRSNAKKAKKQKAAGRHLQINYDELEAQLRAEGHDLDEMVLNKMHPGDINYRDKRLTKMIGVYQDDLNAS